MSNPLHPVRPDLAARAQRALEAVLRVFSLYMVPIGIGLISLTALFFWDNHYVASGDRPLELRVVAEQVRGPRA
jgi:hypothetical protein